MVVGGGGDNMPVQGHSFQLLFTCIRKSSLFGCLYAKYELSEDSHNLPYGILNPNVDGHAGTSLKNMNKLALSTNVKCLFFNLPLKDRRMMNYN